MALRDVAFSTIHNLRQPTMALRGALQRILRAYDRNTLTIENAVEITRDALQYLQRSESIVMDVLRYLKPLALRRRTIQLYSLVQPLAAIYEKPHASLHIVLNIPQEMTVRADEESLCQVVEELFSNAIKAMDGRGTIRVYASYISSPGRGEVVVPHVRFTVEDTGPGVPSKRINSLFKPFMSNDAQGTGLGLAFVKRVIDEHGGHVQYESATPRGSRFILVIPAIEVPMHGS